MKLLNFTAAEQQPMERTLMTTADGSHTIGIPTMEVTYHSKHGAIQESMHVFIHAGLDYCIEQSSPDKVRILEMGFGTGLNALLTLIEAEKQKLLIEYETIEAYPLEQNLVDDLNYPSQLQRDDLLKQFMQLHSDTWDKQVNINPHFNFQKHQASLLNFSSSNHFDLIFYDAFAPAAQPELWTATVFSKLFSMMNPDAVLVTYCSKGDVRRALLEAGFKVEKIPGPKGKREMLRAMKKVI